MAVLERSELEASPLADLHAIADQVGLDGFRRLRKADLIDTILERMGGDEGGTSAAAAPAGEEEQREPGARRRRGGRSRRSRAGAEREPDGDLDGEEEGPRSPAPSASRRGRARGERGEGTARESSTRESSARESSMRQPSTRASSTREAPAREEAEERGSRDRAIRDRPAEGVVELLGNGSAFLRVDPPEPSDDDVYISAAQVRRCELVSGDRVSGPVRTPRRSERYPSMARVDTINGVSAEAVAEGPRYDDLPVAHPDKRLELDANDPTLKAIEWLTPIGLGSRAVIAGSSRAGKSETLRRILGALAGREGLEVSVVLTGVRPEEILDWQGPVAPAVTLNFAASPDVQGQAVEHAIDTARRVAVRGADAVVLIDSLDGLHPHVARRALCAARNLAESGSLTVIAAASHPLGGESTVIALDAALTGAGRLPALDLGSSGTLRPELLVGEEEAQAITRARAAALAG
jgi:transcription termination factor Rho